MTPISTPSASLLLVVLPEGAIEPELYNYAQGYASPFIDFWMPVAFSLDAREIQLPPGSYSILATRDSLTEEVAASVAEINEMLSFESYYGGETIYTSYMAGESGRESFYRTALESFSSLLSSHSIDPTSNWVCLKQS